jgi:colicin import membrane protein
MAESSSRPISLSERPLSFAGRDERLSRWLFFSLVLHGVLILSLFVMPFLPARNTPSYPVYTVDLLGGEKIGGNNLGTELPSSVAKATKTPPAETPRPIKETKQEPKKEKIKPLEEKTKPVERAKPVEKASIEEKLPAKDAVKKEPTKREPTKETKAESGTEETALERVRESLIQSAVDRVKSRAETAQKAPRGDVISSGSGEGEGAAALGLGGRGGGTVKGMEFIIYQNRMFSSIKENWAWVGQRSNLRVVVHFSIKDNGEITGLKIVQPSGDSSYDESVVRAVKKSSPLPPPPESFRKDFADVEIAFRPKDLGA